MTVDPSKQKHNSRSEYQKRIQKALTYIRENLDKPLSLEGVAKAACFSKYHFHRVFSAIMSEPLGEYVTRKKLERAAIRLAYSPVAKVSDMAFAYGYASVSSFSKALNQWFGSGLRRSTASNYGIDAESQAQRK